MKQVLISCDSCGSVVPAQSFAGWWGLAITGGDAPDMKFSPLCGHTIDDFQRHVCSERCLTLQLTSFAKAVDMKKVSQAKPRMPYPGMFSFSQMFEKALGSDMGDSIQYYGEKKKDEDEDEG